MKNKYIDLIEQTFYFPQDGYRVENENLLFNDVNLMELIKEYGTPLRVTYLPKISSQIQKAKELFQKGIEKHNYRGKYIYSYCTKSSHFNFVLDEALKNDVHIETSSAFDIDLIRKLYEKGKVDKNLLIISNGLKPKGYTDRLNKIRQEGFENTIPVLDNKSEIDAYKDTPVPMQLGIRIAAEEEPNFAFYTSRLGIRYSDIIEFYKTQIEPNPNLKLRMLHFFINTGIKDTAYYWSELNKTLGVYIELKKICPDLKYLNIGGGLPIKFSLGFEYDYEYMIGDIVRNIKIICDEAGVEEPDIVTEFGSFTVGESGALLFSVLNQKQQNDSELWYMIDGSLMTTMPDIWGINQRFILLPVNKWHNTYHRANIGGLSCDIHDYYNSEVHVGEVYMPKMNPDDTDPLYLGFFHVGAYQETISGYGGIKHCLIPAPKHLILSRDENGKLVKRLFSDEQTSESMMRILGY